MKKVLVALIACTALTNLAAGPATASGSRGPRRVLARKPTTAAKQALTFWKYMISSTERMLKSSADMRCSVFYDLITPDIAAREARLAQLSDEVLDAALGEARNTIQSPNALLSDFADFDAALLASEYRRGTKPLDGSSLTPDQIEHLKEVAYANALEQVGAVLADPNTPQDDLLHTIVGASNIANYLAKPRRLTLLPLLKKAASRLPETTFTVLMRKPYSRSTMSFTKQELLQMLASDEEILQRLRSSIARLKLKGSLDELLYLLTIGPVTARNIIPTKKGRVVYFGEPVEPNNVIDVEAATSAKQPAKRLHVKKPARPSQRPYQKRVAKRR